MDKEKYAAIQAAALAKIAERKQAEADAEMVSFATVAELMEYIRRVAEEGDEP